MPNRGTVALENIVALLQAGRKVIVREAPLLRLLEYKRPACNARVAIEANGALKAP